MYYPQKMRLTQNKIEDILVNILGEEGMPLVQELLGKENVSEFDLATRTKKDIKIVRRVLYKLYNHNLVEFTRKKDKQKGWYIYYWTLIPESIRFSYFKMKRDLLDKLKYQLEEESKELFFVCPQNCVRLNFDQAMDFEFHCPECGELINQDDNEKKKSLLIARISETEKELNKLNEQRKVRRKAIKEKRKEVKVRKKAVKKKVAKKTIKKKPVKKKTKKKVAKKEVKKIVKIKAKKKVVAKKKAIRKKSIKKKVVNKKTTKKRI